MIKELTHPCDHTSSEQRATKWIKEDPIKPVNELWEAISFSRAINYGSICSDNRRAQLITIVDASTDNSQMQQLMHLLRAVNRFFVRQTSPLVSRRDQSLLDQLFKKATKIQTKHVISKVINYSFACIAINRVNRERRLLNTPHDPLKSIKSCSSLSNWFVPHSCHLTECYSEVQLSQFLIHNFCYHFRPLPAWNVGCSPAYATEQQQFYV